jgi:xylulokinase
MLPKILWIRKHLPAASQIHQFVTAAELAVSALGVPPQMDWATASTTMMLDITARTWSQEILRAAGIEPALLPPVCPSGAVIGEIPSPVCAELGLRPGCLLAAGGHDQQVCALGAGLIRPGKATDSLGTVECITTLFETPQLADDLLENNFSNLLHVYGDQIAMLAYNFSSGDLLRWYAETFCSGGASLDELLADLPEQPAEVFVLPHFAGSGTPHLDARAKGAILGLSLTTDRREILRGIIDRQNFEMRLNLDVWRRNGIAFDTLRAYGKGSTTDHLLQLKADMLQLAIEQLAVVETGCLGAALLAARGRDAAYPLEDMLCRTVTCRRRFEPRRQHAGVYDERFAMYRELYPAIRKLQQRK